MKAQSLQSKHDRIVAAYLTIAITMAYYSRLKMLMCFRLTAGDMTGVTDENGHKTSFAYDALGRMTGMCNALNQCESYHYNAAGQMDTTTNRRGQTVSFTYDLAGQLKTKSYSGYSASFDYDLSGNPLNASDNNGTVSYAYEAAKDRVSSVSFAGAGLPSYTTSYGYDDEDNITSSSGPNGAMGYSYDDAGRLTTISSPAGDFSFSYYDRGLVKSMTYPNGVAANYTFDSAGQLTLLENKKGAAPVVSSFAYHYDADGNRDVITDAAGAHAYGYDVLDQLTSADHPAAQAAYNPDESYLYDSVGNRVRTHLSNIHVVNALNQLLEDDKYKYEYDADGNLNKKTEKDVPANVTTYTFNPENQLTRVDMPGGKFAAFKYDVLGRRIEINDNGAITRFAYDGDDLAAEYNASNVLVNTYVYGPGIDNILARKQGAVTLFYHKDALQSVVALTDAAGNVVQSYKYDSFGNVVSASGTVADNRIMYTGREWDKLVGLYYYRARYYDARAGGFTSEDSEWQQHLYLYVENRPTGLIDPLGNSSTPGITICPSGAGEKCVHEIIQTIKRGVNSAAIWYSKTKVGIFLNDVNPSDKKIGESLVELIKNCKEGDWLSGIAMNPMPVDVIGGAIPGNPAMTGLSNGDKLAASGAMLGDIYLAGRGAFGVAKIAEVAKVENTVQKVSRIVNGTHKEVEVGKYSKIMPYKEAKKKTKGFNHDIEAHNLVGNKNLRNMGASKKEIDMSPAQVLTRGEHAELTLSIRNSLEYGVRHDPERVFSVYQYLYRDYPGYVDNITPYFTGR